MSAIRVRSLDGGRLEGLLRAGHAADVTLNDVLLRDLFLVLRDRCGAGMGPDECLCVAMPVNLREPDEAAMPAANKITLSLLRRPPAACDDPAGLLRDLRRETLAVKATRRGVRLLDVIRVIVAVTGKVPQRFLRKTLATIVLTNLGRLGGREAGLATDADGRLLCGGLVIEQVVTAPNGRPGTSAVLCALTYAGRLCLCLWFDGRVLSEAGGERLLDDYVARLEETARVSPKTAS
jgi:hypothetical protein